MSEGFEHPWKVSPSQAVNIQKQISSRIIERPLRGPIRLVAGVDAAIYLGKDKIVAGVVLLQLQEPWQAFPPPQGSGAPGLGALEEKKPPVKLPARRD